MCLGVMLCNCPQEMLFYVKCTSVFKAVMFILSFFQSILSYVFTEHLLGRQPEFILGKNKIKNKKNAVHRVCSHPTDHSSPFPLPRSFALCVVWVR